MEREVLRKKNREEYNQFLLKLNELYDPNEYGSIQNLARTKIMDFMAYCDSRDVYYFSELPISEIVNKLILEIVEDSLVFNDEENAIMKKLKDNRGFGFNILDHLRLYRIRSKYFKLYSVLSEWCIESIYYQGYKVYYERAFNNDVTSEELEQYLERDSELAIKLGMEEEFSMIKEFVNKKKCKTNVYKGK